MLDLCSGLGGASEAFVRAGWEVVRIDNNPLLAKPTSGWYVPYTIEDDVRDPTMGFFWKDAVYDFVWASPDCVEFSNAYSAPKPTAIRNGEEFEADLTLVRSCYDIIRELNPRNWVLENVSGASKIISKELGFPPWQIVGPFFMWGKFPRLMLDYDWRHKKSDKETGHELRANHKAKIPLELSEAFLDALTNQSTLARWTR